VSKSKSLNPEFGHDLPLLSDAEMPWRRGENGDVIINWDYVTDVSDVDPTPTTLRNLKREWEQELVEEHDEGWLGENRQRLDVEFEMIVTRGLLT